jgi:hypothetical protein
MQTKNKEYRYAFDTSDFECGHRIVFLYDSEISESEFKEICDECIATAVYEYINTKPLHGYNESDKEMMVVSALTYGDNAVELWGDSFYSDLDEHMKRIIELMNAKGFVIESLPIVTSFHANIYTYIKETYGDSIEATLKERCVTENLPVFKSWEEEEKVRAEVSKCDTVEAGLEVLKAYR